MSSDQYRYEDKRVIVHMSIIMEKVSSYQFVGTKGVSQNHLLSFDDNKVLKIINWIC